MLTALQVGHHTILSTRPAFAYRVLEGVTCQVLEGVREIVVKSN